MRINWESVDEFRPPRTHYRKHIPESEWKTLDLAIAQRNNNALQALSYSKPKPCRTRSELRQHTYIMPSRYPSQDMVHTPIKASQGKSGLETMPAIIIRAIFKELPYADFICLGLTSKILSYHGKRSFGVLLDNFDDIESKCEESFGPGDHMQLMYQLKSSIPDNYKFCHHCARYLSRFNFNPPDTLRDSLICMDCKIHEARPVRGEPPWYCWGCEILDVVEADLEDNYLAGGWKACIDEVNSLPESIAAENRTNDREDRNESNCDEGSVCMNNDSLNGESDALLALALHNVKGPLWSSCYASEKPWLRRYSHIEVPRALDGSVLPDILLP